MNMGRTWLFCASLVVGSLGLAAGASISADGAVPGGQRGGCGATIRITQLRFVPPSVARGANSTARVTAQNCSGQSQSTELMWLGRFMGKHVSGCPVIDPVAEPATFTALGTFKAKLTYDLSTSCTASRLRVTARFSGSGGTQLAQKSASLSITP